MLYDEIIKLPFEKIDKAISFIRYLEKETEQELILDEDEEDELLDILNSSDFVASSDVLSKIKGL